MKIEVLIIHSSCYPSKRAYVKLASQVGGEIEKSKSLVLHVHTQGTRRVAHTAKSQHGRPAHTVEYERLRECHNGRHVCASVPTFLMLTARAVAARLLFGTAPRRFPLPSSAGPA